MSKYLKWILPMFGIGIALSVFAQTPAQLPSVTDVAPVDPSVSFLQLLLQSIGGMKGASVAVIVGLVVQLLLRLLDLPFVENFLGKSFSDWSGKIKLLVVSGLTLVSGIASLMAAGGISIGAALVHSTTLTAMMVFANQLYQQLIQKPAEAKAAVVPPPV